MCADEPLARRWRRFHHTFVALAFFGSTLAYAVMLLVRQQILSAWSTPFNRKPPIAFVGIYVCRWAPARCWPTRCKKLSPHFLGSIFQTAISEFYV